MKTAVAYAAVRSEGEYLALESITFSQAMVNKWIKSQRELVASRQGMQIQGVPGTFRSQKILIVYDELAPKHGKHHDPIPFKRFVTG